MSEEKSIFITLAIALAALTWFLFRINPFYGIVICFLSIAFWWTFLGVIGVLR